LGFRWWQRQRRDLPRRLRAAAQAYAGNLCIPDGNGGEITLPDVLLTAAGITVLEIRETAGNVFGSEGMQEWTVIDTRQRYTFPNPQPAVWDRVAAVKRLLPAVPVEGFIVFAGEVSFPKGTPRGAMVLAELVRRLESSAAGPGPPPYGLAWEQLLAAGRRD
jgi:Nuclease-related domain